MSEKKRNILWRIIAGTWRGVDEARRFTVNVLFILLVFFLLLMWVGSKPLPVERRTALVIEPVGVVVEQFTGDPVEIAIEEWFGEERRETRIRDMVQAIDRAADDKHITSLVLVPDQLEYIGLEHLQELRGAVERFRGSGKPVLALASFLMQNQYYFSSLADEILMHPDGMVWLEGFSRYRNYYRGGLDKLAVDVHLFRVGEYKSAGEVYIREGMSEEAREANLSWLNDLWNGYLADVAEARDLEPAVFSEYIESFADDIEEYDGNAAQLALDLGLVDHLAHLDEMESRVIEHAARDLWNGGFRRISATEYLARTDDFVDGRPEIAVIVAQGAIVGGEQPPGVIGSESLGHLIRQAREDTDIKALVLRVDSPGGDAFASEIIRRELELTKMAGKPVVVSMANVAASGGYWISMSADEIWAGRGTITGSIGIYGLFMTIPETLAKIGITTDGVGTTSLAGTFRADRKLDGKVSRIIQSVIEDGYDDFISLVAHAREMTEPAVDAIARGRVWSGAQAEDLGLVDKIGGLNDALNAAARFANLDEYQVTYVEPQLTWLEQFLVGASAKTLSWVGSGELKLGGIRLPSGFASQIIEDLRLIQQRQGPFTAYAYCFCSPR